MAEKAYKLRPGYTFHHPVTGVALQRSLVNPAGETEVVAINKDGGQEKLPGPFFLLDEEDVKGQKSKFELATPEELERLKAANSKEIKVKLAPKNAPMKSIVVEDKQVKSTPADKEVKAKAQPEPPPAVEKKPKKKARKKKS